MQSLTDSELNAIRCPDNAPNIKMETSLGTIVLELYWNECPVTCYNLHALSMNGYYDETCFHRIIPNFLVQAGDPTGSGTGGMSAFGKPFKDETKKDLKHTGAGILCMANTGPNTNGSQFFLTLAPTPWLDGKNTIFGRVKSGMKVLQRMSFVETDSNDR